MYEVDWVMGQIVQAVADSGMPDHALIIFTSDNGPEGPTPDEPMNGCTNTSTVAWAISGESSVKFGRAAIVSRSSRPGRR